MKASKTIKVTFVNRVRRVNCIRRPAIASALGVAVFVVAIGSPLAAFGQVTDLICPSGSIFAQPPDLGSADWNAYISDLTPFYIRYERTLGAPGPICGLRWWGFNAYDTGSGFAECVETPMSFQVTFYRDEGGQPGDEVCSYVIDATGAVVAEVNGWDLYLYEAALESCCVLTDGWMSVAGLGGDPSCWFMWNSSWAGDDSACQRNAEGFVCGTGQHFRDLSLCLTDSPVPVKATTWGAIKSLYKHD